MILALLGVLASALPAPQTAPGAVLAQEEPRAAALKEVRARLLGDFLGAEHKDERIGQGFLRSREVAGGFLARDYWSEGRGKRLYAGHDVLELKGDGSARHWWFGSRGDYAYAEGDWTPARLRLVVLDGGDPVRRYTYSFAGGGLAAEGQGAPPPDFRFLNEHAQGKGWKPFMHAEWRRGRLSLPADFLPDPEACSRSSPFWPYLGILRGPAGEHRGRLLFGKWLVFDTTAEHAVMEKGWFGRLGLRLWAADGSFHRLGCRREGGRLLFRDPEAGVDEAASPPFRSDQPLPEGYRTTEISGRVREYRR